MNKLPYNFVLCICFTLFLPVVAETWVPPEDSPSSGAHSATSCHQSLVWFSFPKSTRRCSFFLETREFCFFTLSCFLLAVICWPPSESSSGNVQSQGCFASAFKVQSSSRGIFMFYKQSVPYLGPSVSFSLRTSSFIQFYPWLATVWSLISVKTVPKP